MCERVYALLSRIGSMARKNQSHRASGTKRSPAAKPGPKGAPRNIEEYLARVPESARTSLRKLGAAIRAALPPAAVEIISYRIPAFHYKQVVVWFAAFSGHCSFFPTAAVIEAHKDELKGYVLSKGTIQFPTDKPLPAPLVRRLAKTLLAHIEKKQR
jgi:uncharacterized protein YdhG (YjbR/CyaY superfamily)